MKISRTLIVDPRGIHSDAWLYDDEDEQSALVSWGVFEGFNLAAFDDFLEEPGWEASDISRKHLDELLRWRANALTAWKTGERTQTTAYLTLMKNDMDRVREREKLLPLAHKGNAFKPGRTAGTEGSMKTAVRAYLEHYPTAQAREIWESFKAKPPEGLSFRKSPRLGEYFEDDADVSKSTGRQRFGNIVSEVKKR